jgi:predicted O-methyltransferase YrrM
MNMRKYLKYRWITRNRVRLPLDYIKGKRDKRRLEKKLPQLRTFSKQSHAAVEDLRSYYDEYILNFSSNDMAISLELAVFLMTLCYLIKPKRILDLGSGFSSFVFRRYQSRTYPRAEIWTIDDNPYWLEQTRIFLSSYDLLDDNLAIWNAFIQEEQGDFDLILHDLGSMEIREETLTKVITLSRPNGLIVLDDFHKTKYRASVTQKLKHFEFEFYSLRSYTIDKLGRYSILLTDYKKK